MQTKCFCWVLERVENGQVVEVNPEAFDGLRARAFIRARKKLGEQWQRTKVTFSWPTSLESWARQRQYDRQLP
jgi:hypothetical protein